MKKFVCFILCLILLVSFVACEDPNESSDLNTQSTESNTTTELSGTQESVSETEPEDENDGWTNIY